MRLMTTASTQDPALLESRTSSRSASTATGLTHANVAMKALGSWHAKPLQTLDEHTTTVSTTTTISRYYSGRNLVGMFPSVPLAIQIPLCDTPIESDPDAANEDKGYSLSDLKDTADIDCYKSNVDGSLIPLRSADTGLGVGSIVICDNSGSTYGIDDYASKNSATLQLNPTSVRFYEPMCELKAATREGVSSVAYGIEQHLLACAYESGTIVVWNLAKQKVVRVLEKHSGPVYSLQWAPFSKHELLSSGRDGTVRIWSIEDGLCRVSMRDHAANGVTCAVWSEDGQILATTGKSRHLLVYNLSRAKVNDIDLNTASRSALMLDIKPKGPSNSKGHSAVIRKIIWTRDNFYLISASDDSSIVSWNVAQKGRFEREFVGHTQRVNVICLDDRGTNLLSCSSDGSLKVWMYGTAECLRTMRGGHTGEVLTAQWIPRTGGRRIASSGDDNAVCIWEASTGLSMQKLSYLHPAACHSVSFRSDGLVFATGAAGSAVGLVRALRAGKMEMCRWSAYSCGMQTYTRVTNMWCCNRRRDAHVYVGDTHRPITLMSAFPSLHTLSKNMQTEDIGSGASSEAIGVDGSCLLGAPKLEAVAELSDP